MGSTGSNLDIDLDVRVADLLDRFGDFCKKPGDEAALAAFRAAGERLTNGIRTLNRLAPVPFKGPHGWTAEQTAAFLTPFVIAAVEG